LKVTWNQPLGRPECPYAYRWKIDFGRLGSIRLHKWVGSDDMRAPHDHAADFITLILKGGYTDIASHGDNPSEGDYGEFREHLRVGNIRRRKAEHRHRVLIDPGGDCWTLLYYFPHRRKWGFWVPRKLDGRLKLKKANKYFLEHGHHPCD
jgi:hypothetical protein